MTRLLLPVVFITTLSQAMQEEQPVLCDFNKSTAIIMHLLKTDRINVVVEEGAPTDQVERLVKNFSPAQMALETEVLNCTVPVLLYFYTEHDAHKKTTDFLVKHYAQQHGENLKVVAIDAEEYFSIAQLLEIEKTPYFARCTNREITEQTDSTDFLIG